MKIRVAVLFGGKSVEHEVSVISGIQAVSAFNREKYEIIPVYMTKNNEMYIGERTGDISAYKNIPELLKTSKRVILVNENGHFYFIQYPVNRFKKNEKIEADIAFPVVHGTNVEDGALQGYLKTIGIPFVGCDVTASAIGMDKYATKQILKDCNVPVLDCLKFHVSAIDDMKCIQSECESKIGYPMIVKPVNLGSSVGIAVAKNGDELVNCVNNAFNYAREIIVEKAITKLREINCSVVGDADHAEASECEEPMHTDEILSYKDKYQGGSKNKTGGSKGMAGVSRKIPADISDEMRLEIRELAVKSFKALGCSGISRIDFMIDEEKGKLYFNEINTIPGSLAFYLWEPLGVPYDELLERAVNLCLKRSREENAISFSFDSNILANANIGGAKGTKGKLG